MLKKEVNVERRSVILPQSIATISKSVRPLMANTEMNVELISVTHPESITTIPNSMRPHMANKEMNVEKGNEC